MSEENKEKSFETPMVPLFGLDMARELGAIDARLKQLEGDNREIKREIKEVDARLSAKIEAVDSRVDKCLVAINRMDERMASMDERMAAMSEAHKANFEHVSEGRKSDHNLLLGILAAIVAGFVVQFITK